MENMLPDIPRYFTAISEWAACLVYILTLRKRWGRGKLIAAQTICLAVQILFLTLTANVDIVLWVPCMLTAFAMMAWDILYSCDISWRDAVYAALQAFVAAEFIASLEWQIYCFFFYDRPQLWLKLTMMFLFYGLFFLLYWFLVRRFRMQDGRLDIRNSDLISTGIIAVAVFTVSNISFLPVWTPFSSSMGTDAATLRTMMDLGGVAILYSHYLQRAQIRVRQELAALHDVLKNQYLQYEQSKETIEMINYKYHDLKHQIAYLRAEEDPKKRKAYIDRMEEEIRQYEAQNKTGNKVLDTVLTSKSMICEKYNINFNCVADGSLLEFLDVMDICSIFGNALDNAIESEKQIEDPEKRMIHMAVFSQNDFLIMRFENYFEGQLHLQDGLPQTTKVKRREFHGYGIKSIRHTVEKYNGAVNIGTKDNWFELKVLIPMQNGV